MSDIEGFKITKSTRMAAIEAAKRIKKNAEYNAQRYPLYRDETVAQSDVATNANNKQKPKGGKRKREDQVVDSAEDSSDNISKCSDPSKSDDMRNKRRGRPPKPRSTKSQSRRSRNTKHKEPKPEEADYDVNQRRESYNSFRLNNEPTFASIFPGPKQLQLGDGGISYKESLMRFTKGLGPTAQKVALRMLQRHDPTHQAQHQPEPLLQSPDSQCHPQLDLNSINDSVKNTITNQTNQPFFSFGDSNADYVANHKGKSIMVDDGKSKHNKWDAVDKLELLFGKQKGGVKIGSSGSLENKDFGNKNLDYGLVSNQSTINNQISSFFPNYSGNLNQNVHKIPWFQDISGQKEAPWNASNQTTNASRYGNISRSSLGFDGEVGAFSWVLQPPMHSPTPMVPTAININAVANDSFWKDPDFQLALALNKQRTDQESNVWSQNLWAPSQTNQFLQPHPHGPVRQQPQDRLLMPTPPDFWSQMGNNMQQGSRFKMGNNMQHPPPGI